MYHDDLQELKLLIVANLDVTDLLDILGLEMADLVDLLEEHIEEKYTQLRRATR